MTARVKYGPMITKFGNNISVSIKLPFVDFHHNSAIFVAIMSPKVMLLIGVCMGAR